MSVKVWIFTKFNYDEAIMDSISISIITDAKFIVWQEEKCPTSGRLHIQGFIRFHSNHRQRWVKSAFNVGNDISVRVADGNDQQQINYCNDEKKRLAGGRFYREGQPCSQGHRTDIELLEESLKSGVSLVQISEDHFSSFIRYHKGILLYRTLHYERRKTKPTVLVFYGPAGSGKTRKAVSIDQDFYILSPGNSKNCWFDGYTQQRVVIIDDYYGWMRYGFLLQLLDRYPFRVELKGSSQEFDSPFIIITSNNHPQEWYDFSTRMEYAPLERRISNIYKFPLALDVTFDF